MVSFQGLGSLPDINHGLFSKSLHSRKTLHANSRRALNLIFGSPEPQITNQVLLGLKHLLNITLLHRQIS